MQPRQHPPPPPLPFYLIFFFIFSLNCRVCCCKQHNSSMKCVYQPAVIILVEYEGPQKKQCVLVLCTRFASWVHPFALNVLMPHERRHVQCSIKLEHTLTRSVSMHITLIRFSSKNKFSSRVSHFNTRIYICDSV